ncbi:hypothetical protein FITA111629_00245 [Filibacter tadaridae]|uniref:YneQ n=1 Tax=Filibacter tadaridae TaxID=2483811 RepID=A0A3P5XJG4_9BACL|nr:hypothetical protein [Filibacter tadaridae]VDC28910.1 hypothetical protein FILTAD_01898 [Filibacter tadaridae]
MAFGIKREELNAWKAAVGNNKIGFLTHYWIDERFPGCTTVTKVGCADIKKLVEWGRQYGLKQEWIDKRGDFPHFDLFGKHEREIMEREGLSKQLERFHPHEKSVKL